jgi:phenylacetate-coenzyme A ligase PaaK-like adenylate-forming protein
MRSWDEIVTDQSLKLKNVQHFLENMKSFGLYRNKYYAFATGGTTGVKGVFVYNKEEFLTMFALTARASGWMGVHLNWRELPRAAVVQSHLPWHVAGAAQSIKVPLLKTLVLDSLEPMEQLVWKLNAFQPHMFGGYAGNVHLLAEEQIAGRLHITPKTVLTTAETLKKEARKAIEKAWGIKPFEVYGATETAEAASECQEHNGLHIYDDMVILEVVDRDNKPVPAGTYGSKVLATVLWRRSIPLIRYEISDHLMLSSTPCPCSRPFPLIQEIQGREEQVITLTGKTGDSVRIEPDLFFDAMVLLPIDGWQVVQKSKNALTFLILKPHSSFNEQELLKRMSSELEAQGAKNPVLKVEYIKELRRTKVGKVITIQAFHS